MSNVPTTDNFGRTVTVSSDGVTDTYTVLNTSGDTIFTIERPTGTDWTTAFFTINAMGAPAAPVIIVPQQVTRWQAWSQMMLTSSFINPPPATVFTDVQAIVQATGGPLLLAWQNQGYVYRNGPFMGVLAPQLGLTPAILDNLFIAASSLPQ